MKISKARDSAARTLARLFGRPREDDLADARRLKQALESHVFEERGGKLRLIPRYAEVLPRRVTHFEPVIGRNVSQAIRATYTTANAPK